MKFLVALFVLVAITVAYDFPEENENFDIEGLVKDRVALRMLTECFLDEIECDAIGQTFRDKFPHAVETACAECNEHQRWILRTYLEGLRYNFYLHYVALKKKYDPQGNYFDNLWMTLVESGV